MSLLTERAISDRPMLLEWSLQHFLDATPPPAIAGATEALARAEVSRSSSDVSAYVRPTLQWLDNASDLIFPMPAEPTEKSAVMRSARLAVDQGPLHAAFSGWRLRFGTHGVWLALVDRLREVAVEYGVAATPLGPTEASLAQYPVRYPPRPPRMEAGTLSALGDDASADIYGRELFLLVCDELKLLVADQSALDEIRAILRLSETDLAALIGVRRQAVTQWRVRGIPTDRATLVDQYLELARYLSTSFAPHRIPAIIRRPVPSLEGQSWLDNMRERGPEDTQARLRAVLSYQLI